MSEAVQVQAAVISNLCRIPPFHSLSATLNTLKDICSEY
jgi:hypothetical protein